MQEDSLRPQPSRPEPSLPDAFLFMDTGPFHWRLAMRAPAWRPPTDVYESEDQIVVRVEIAGMHEDDFKIELDGLLLSIRGVRSDTTERRAYHQMEIRFGEFSSDIELPAPVVASEVDATYKDGFLRIVLPKERAHTIDVEE